MTLFTLVVTTLMSFAATTLMSFTATTVMSFTEYITLVYPFTEAREMTL